MITNEQLFFNYKLCCPKKVGFLAFVILFMCTNGLFAQQKMVITGVVTSASEGTTIPGVNIFIKDTNKGVVTDFNGKYSIEASKGNILTIIQ